jgi:hypothetical protein
MIFTYNHDEITAPIGSIFSFQEMSDYDGLYQCIKSGASPYYGQGCLFLVIDSKVWYYRHNKNNRIESDAFIQEPIDKWASPDYNYQYISEPLTHEEMLDGYYPSDIPVRINDSYL